MASVGRIGVAARRRHSLVLLLDWRQVRRETRAVYFVITFWPQTTDVSVNALPDNR
jgi:hypothetical protein